MVVTLFEEALGVQNPWYVDDVSFDPDKGLLTISIDFVAGTKFSVPDVAGAFGAYDTEIKEYRHLSFFQHECILSVRVPRVKLEDGSTRVISPPWSGKLNGFTLLFEAFILMLEQNGMTFAAVRRIARISEYKAKEICVLYTEAAIALRSLKDVTSIAIDETSRAKGHAYVSIIADAETRAVIDVQPDKDAAVLAKCSETLVAHGGQPDAITDICMDMYKAFIAGAALSFPKAQITFDKFHVIMHANQAVDLTRRAERKHVPELKKKRYLFLKDRTNLSAFELDACEQLMRDRPTLKTIRAYQYKEWLRKILDYKQHNVVAHTLKYWCRTVERARLPEFNELVALIRRHWNGIIRWTRSRIPNGFMEALNGLFQAAKAKARGYQSFRTIRAIIFLIGGKLDYSKINPQVFQPT